MGKDENTTALQSSPRLAGRFIGFLFARGLRPYPSPDTFYRAPGSYTDPAPGPGKDAHHPHSYATTQSDFQPDCHAPLRG